MSRQHTPIREIPVLRTVAKLLVPFILLFALYVQFHGDYGPGGGFQAGVIFAAGLILHALIFGLEDVRRAIPPRVVEVGSAAGVLIYGGTGVASFFWGANFLDYNPLLADNLHAQHMGILLVELGVGVTVTFVMLLIFYCLVGRKQVRRRDAAADNSSDGVESQAAGSGS